jgi:hypothetical protein
VARLGAVLLSGAGFGLFSAAPVAAAQGLTVEVTDVPGQFVAGDGASRISAVISGDPGAQCVKVRWSLVVRADGLLLEQVLIDRIEETGSFPTEARREGSGARLTDTRLDPGTLCVDQTVTAQYDVAIAEEVTDGRLTLLVEAYDVNERMLARQAVERDVVSDRAREGAAGRTERDPDESDPADEESPDVVEIPPADQQPGAGLAASQNSGDGTGLVQAGFAIGAVLLFLGGGLLIRLRSRMAEGDDDDLRHDRPARASNQRAFARGARPMTVRRRRPVRY